jgi:hypothetical protein
MSTAAKVGTMSDPSDLVVYTSYFGTGGLAILLLTRVWKLIFSDRAEIQMMKELQDENAKLRTRIEVKEADNRSLMQEKLTYAADLRSALAKIDFLSEQLELVKQELVSLKSSVRGS